MWSARASNTPTATCTARCCGAGWAGHPVRRLPLPGGLSALGRRLVELLLLRRALHRRHRRLPAGRDLGDLVEVPHAHELLVPHRRVAVLLRGELAIL